MLSVSGHWLGAATIHFQMGEMRDTVLLILMARSNRVCVAIQAGVSYMGYDIAPSLTCNVRPGGFICAGVLSILRSCQTRISCV